MIGPGEPRHGAAALRADAIGVDLGGTKIEALRLAADGRERWRERVATPSGDYAATLRAIVALVERARAVDPAVATTVGIGTPGSPTPAGLMKNCNSTCLNGRPLQRDLQTLLGQPLALANDADCLALSEATDGAGAGAAVVFAVILGTGVGGGIAVDGRVRQGPNGLRGEWGHNPLPWPEADECPGPACYCGRRGCIEAWLSGPALARDHGRPGTPVEPIVAAATAGDATARATIDRHGRRLARALAAVINLLDPDTVVLAGGVSRLPGLVDRVQAHWARWLFAADGAAPGAARPPAATRLALALHGDASGVRGAAWLGRDAAGVP